MAQVIGGIVYDADGVLVANVAASKATTVAALVADFNALLEKLKEAGVMEADPAPEA